MVISKYHFKISDDWHTDNTFFNSLIHTEYAVISWKLVGALCEEHSKSLQYYFSIIAKMDMDKHNPW